MLTPLRLDISNPDASHDDGQRGVHAFLAKAMVSIADLDQGMECCGDEA
jgi:hypothetical protein